MQYARIIDGEAVEVVDAETVAMFTEEVAALFEKVPDGTATGSTYTGGAWVAPPVVEPGPAPEPVLPPKRKRLSPIEFKMQFTSAERLAIRAARVYTGTDAQKVQIGEAIDDFFDLMDDPRLTTVDLDHPTTIEGVNALAAFGLIAAGRVAEILAGVDG